MVLTERKEFIAASMLFQVLFLAQTVVTYIAELLGITEVSVPLFGDVSAGWNMDHPDVMHQQLGKRNFNRLVIKAINIALGGKDDMIVALEQNIASVLALEDENSMESIKAKLEELQKELLKRANAKKDYNDLADEIDRLRELKQNAMAENAEREGLKQRIAEMQEFLVEQMEQIEEYDEKLVRRLIEKVTVYEEKFMVEFKSGTSVDVER